MDENTQQEFIDWLSTTLKVESPEELEGKLKEMGEDGIKKAFDMFSKQRSAKVLQSGGKLEYLKKLQMGGKMQTQAYRSPIKNELVTDKDVLAMKNAGMDFGTKQAYGAWLDTWGAEPSAQVQTPSPATPPRTIRRYNQAMRSWETVSPDAVMAEQNVQTVGQPGAWGKWDTSAFKKQITPQDTVGKPNYIKQNVQQGWDMQKVKHAEGGKIEAEIDPKLEYIKCLALHKKGGSMKKASCGCSGAKITKIAKTGAILDKGKDGRSALGGRKDSGKKEHTANIGNNPKGKDGKTAVGITKWLKGKDSKSALGGRKDSGKKEHSALVSLKGAGGLINDGGGIHTPPKTTKAVKKLQPKKAIVGQGADGVLGNAKMH